MPLPGNKMAFRNFLIPLGYKQFCVVRGKVSLPGFDEGTGELRLRYHAKKSQYLIDAYKTSGGGALVCQFFDVFVPECTHADKIKISLFNIYNIHKVRINCWASSV